MSCQHRFFPATSNQNISVDITSTNANVVVGIEVAGSSMEVTIVDNFVNLVEGVMDDPNDKFVALRLRSKVDIGTIIEKKNILVQGVKKEERGVTGRHLSSRESKLGQLRSLLDANFHDHDTEWAFGATPGRGGCPFASR